MSILQHALARLPWLDASGPGSEVALATRVRLARNLVGHRFPARAREQPVAGGDVVMTLVEQAVHGIGRLVRLGDVPRLERVLLHERQVMSQDLAAVWPHPSGGEGLLFAPEAVAMVNEEDHLRIQGMASGLNLSLAHGAADRLDTALGERLPFAFHPEFGYLTACPTNVGTGLRASVLMHLPGLVLTGEFARVMRAVGELGLAHRGWNGEGSSARGHLVQLSNQTTLGVSESGLLEHLGRVVRQVMGHELRARDVLWRDGAAAIEDRIWRAHAILGSARHLSVREAFQRLSLVRLGVTRGRGPQVSLAWVHRMLVQVQAGHVAQAAGVGLDDGDLAVHRATLVRRRVDEEGRGQ